MKIAWLLRLYPRAWRRRYGDEFAALLEQHPASPRLIMDLVLGAIDAHLWPQVSAAGADVAAEAAVGGRAMLSEEYRGRVSIDPSLAIGIALSAVMLAMFVLVAIGPGTADSASVFYSYLCSLNPQQ